jgi:Na+-driven multidrug efflux pump
MALLLIYSIELVLIITPSIMWRSAIIHLFTSDEEVVEIVTGLIPLLRLMTIGIASSAFNGITKQKYSLYLYRLYISCVAYLVLAMPMTYGLAFRTSLDLHGIWIGNCTGGLFYAIASLVNLCHVDWHVESRKGSKRAFSMATDLVEPLLEDIIDDCLINKC